MKIRCMKASRANQLRQSYLGISGYIRNQLQYAAGRTGYLAEKPASQRVFCNSVTRKKNDRDERTANYHPSPPHVPHSHPKEVTSDQAEDQTRRSQRRPPIVDILNDFQRASEVLTASSDSWEAFDRDAQIPTLQRASDETVYLHGYVTSIRGGKNVQFVQLVDPSMRRAVQLVCSDKDADETATNHRPSWGQSLKHVQPHTPVLVSGKVVRRGGNLQALIQAVMEAEKFDPYAGNVKYVQNAEVLVDSIHTLNEFPKSIDAQNGVTFLGHQRHLTFRTQRTMRDRIRFRSELKADISQHLQSRGFVDIETPTLFKSTPEGAREFVVPTREKGLAYALPQSPQQYKQILMASGFDKYFQFARCFRDEDFRADRQPEFTQLDMEMAFTNSKGVMSVIEELILKVVWPKAGRQNRLSLELQSFGSDLNRHWSHAALALPIMTYEEAMSKYGSDKPDPRFGAQLVRAEDWLPANLKGMLTSLNDPIVEMFKLGLGGDAPTESRKLVAEFMKLSSSAQFSKNPDGMPGIAIYDASAPLHGLASFGHEAAAKVEELFDPEPGDVIVAQARPRQPFTGGSTTIGRIRQRLFEAAVEANKLSLPNEDALLWIVDFPLFSPVEEDSPGQEGRAHICATHHPFTAPKVGQELSKLFSDPLSVVGDHFDLVINGQEIGGGSRRIHQAAMQRLIFSTVLQMSASKIEDFQHLLYALEAGCPPHAGFAFGFDRLLAVLTDVSTVRNVIPFPKGGHGEDLMVRAPSRLTNKQLETYHLQLTD